MRPRRTLPCAAPALACAAVLAIAAAAVLPSTFHYWYCSEFAELALCTGGYVLLLRRPGRACIYLLCVGSMIGLGLALGGHIFRLPARGVFEWLGVTANAGTGAFYFLSGMWGGWVSDVSRTAGDYGTRFLAAAGVLNLLFVLDAHEIASRRQR